ncbi:MAG: hypothetical protein R3231_09430 [bacterium]|nr:hypothetical protein [bacterium]
MMQSNEDGRLLAVDKQFFSVHGITVCLTGSCRPVMEETGNELRFFRSRPTLNPTISLQVEEREGLNPAMTHPAGTDLEPGDEVHWVNGEMATVLNIPRRRAHLFLSSSAPVDAAVVVLFGIAGFLLSLELSLREKIASFHGASWEKDGKALLLLGKTNSGKTSLSYVMTGHGFSYLSEEDSFVRQVGQDTFQVLPYPRRIRIAEAVMALQPELRRLPDEKSLVDSLDEKVFRIDSRKATGPVPLKGVILLDNGAETPSISTAPVPKTEALFALLAALEKVSVAGSPPSAWNDLKGRNRRAFSVAKSLVDSLCVKRLKYSIKRDFADLPGVIAGLFETE